MLKTASTLFQTMLCSRFNSEQPKQPTKPIQVTMSSIANHGASLLNSTASLDYQNPAQSSGPLSKSVGLSATPAHGKMTKRIHVLTPALRSTLAITICAATLQTT